MASVNTVAKNNLRTHEGGISYPITPIEELKRSVLSCLLWEDSFYESGESIASRVKSLILKVTQEEAREVLYDAKFKNKLRHMPLYLLVLFAERGWLKSDDVKDIVTRPDDMTELMALYLKEIRGDDKNKKRSFDHQLVKGLSKAFGKFDEYQLAKYNRKTEVKLKDVLCIARPKPKNKEQADLWKRLLEGKLKTPDTWETARTRFGGKKDPEKEAENYTRLIEEKKLGDLAFLRNLQYMTKIGVKEELIRKSMEEREWKLMIPYQFITAAGYNPALMDSIEKAMLKCTSSMERIDSGIKTALLLDNSRSMGYKISDKSQTLRWDIAVGLAIIMREICENAKIYSFNTESKIVPPLRGFALRLGMDLPGGGTRMWKAIKEAGEERHNEVMIVFTDEQTSDVGSFRLANADILFIINVASYERGVGYEKGIVHINGWSDNVVAYIMEYIKAEFAKKADIINNGVPGEI
jgi:hypothetical protein